jgi:hypothetical protein
MVRAMEAGRRDYLAARNSRADEFRPFLKVLYLEGWRLARNRHGLPQTDLFAAVQATTFPLQFH